VIPPYSWTNDPSTDYIVTQKRTSAMGAISIFFGNNGIYKIKL
jgi:hypothetical protein